MNILRYMLSGFFFVLPLVVLLVLVGVDGWTIFWGVLAAAFTVGCAWFATWLLLDD